MEWFLNLWHLWGWIVSSAYLFSVAAVILILPVAFLYLVIRSVFFDRRK